MIREHLKQSKNKYIFLRHAETMKDPTKHAKDWDLTPDALVKIQEYILENRFETFRFRLALSSLGILLVAAFVLKLHFFGYKDRTNPPRRFPASEQAA